jgi:hypothetical protein
MLERSYALVRGWRENVDTERRKKAFEVHQVAVTATREAAEAPRVLPIEPRQCITEEQSSRCTLPGK